MTNDRTNYLLPLAAIFVVAVVLIFAFNYSDAPQGESTPLLEANVEEGERFLQDQEDLASSFSTEIDEAVIKSEEVPEHEIIDQLIANLTEEERASLELQVLQTSISKRVNNLSPGSMSEEELLELFEDIDHLDQHSVFLGKEAVQLKVYVKSKLAY